MDLKHKLNVKTQYGLQNNQSHPQGVAVNSNNHIFITDETSSYKEYSKTFEFIAHHEVRTPDDEETELRGVAIDGHDNVLIGDMWHEYIIKQDVNGKNIGRIKTNIKPLYIAVHDESIIVCDSYKKTVQVIDSDGNVMQTLSPPSGDWDPCQVCCYGDYLFIADHADDRICVFEFTQSQYQYVGHVHTPTMRGGVCGVAMINNNKMVCIMGYPRSKLVLLHKV